MIVAMTTTTTLYDVIEWRVVVVVVAFAQPQTW